jgi:hypothetical protein
MSSNISRQQNTRRAPTLTLYRGGILRTNGSTDRPFDRPRVSHQNNYIRESHIMDSPGHHRSARQLRLITIGVLVPGITLLLIAGFSTRNELPFIDVVPLTLSAFLGLVAVASKDRPMPWLMYADLCMAMFIVSVLIPT